MLIILGLISPLIALAIWGKPKDAVENSLPSIEEINSLKEELKVLKKELASSKEELNLFKGLVKKLSK